ncbi:MAG: hypothetical protein IJ763_10250 [Lachnospiraceae bacterium]|nr:hypothetical protein [Lachnospiraceae bacterium]
MIVENGEWTITGLEYDDPSCIHSPQELIEYVKKVGFLPLFGGDIPGFSAEEHTWYMGWWTGDAEDDPWIWREEIARSREVAYGKFFDKKAGFISLEWLPYFANYRRKGYDFDALYEDGYASRRSKKIMDLYIRDDVEDEDDMWSDEMILSTQVKKLAGFGKGGEKNFPGVLTDLQMQLYLVMIDFKRRRNKKDEEYGMPVSILLPPEAVWGYKHMSSAYKEKPEVSGERIRQHIFDMYPDADEKVVNRLVGK